jgi:hypothetical protein
MLSSKYYSLVLVVLTAMLAPTIAHAARLRIFTIDVTGEKFAFVVDRSRAMGGKEPNPLGTTKTIIEAALKQMNAADRFSLIVYGDQINRFGISGGGTMPAATDFNKGKVTEYLAEYEADGLAKHNAAIQAALEGQPDAIFILSTGSDPPMSRMEMRDFGRNNVGKAKVFFIELGWGPPIGLGPFARQLAKDNGGKTVYVDLLKKKE